MTKAMTLQDLEGLEPGSSRTVTGAITGVLSVGLHLPFRRIRFDVQGWDTLPAEPVVLVANHTHWLDWIALRWVGWWRGRAMCNWVKPRTYEEGYAGFLNKTGNLPVVSRGYLLSADVREVHGRRPSEDEYRALRDHLDSGKPFPDSDFYDAMANTPRDILGLPFDPAKQTWREAIETLFHRMMQATLAHTKTLAEQGVDLQIMPQGVTSLRLTDGHPGALQAALALGMQIVPVGISGFPQAYGPKGKLLPKFGGTVTVRIGEAYTPEPIPGHTPFLPESERAHHEALMAGTDRMMDLIEALVDPAHRRGDDAQEDVVGVSRFV